MVLIWHSLQKSLLEAYFYFSKEFFKNVKNDLLCQKWHILIKVKDKTSFLTCFQATNSQNKIHLMYLMSIF